MNQRELHELVAVTSGAAEVSVRCLAERSRHSPHRGDVRPHRRLFVVEEES